MKFQAELQALVSAIVIGNVFDPNRDGNDAFEAVIACYNPTSDVNYIDLLPMFAVDLLAVATDDLEDPAIVLKWLGAAFASLVQFELDNLA